MVNFDGCGKRIGIPNGFDSEEFEEILTFLDDLRESGTINMFGAVPVLSEEFTIDKGKAKEALQYWMSTFAERHGG